MIRFLTIAVILVSVGLAGCQKKVTKVTESPLPKENMEKVTPVKPEIRDTTMFERADVQGDLLRKAGEVLRNIYFEYDKADILPQSEDQLRKIGEFMLEHTDIRILVAGNCDERGSSEYNIGLGEKRARAATRFLVAFGVPEKRMELTSYGKERLAASGCEDIRAMQKIGEMSFL